VREVRYARGGTDGVMHVYARTRELVFVRIKYFDGGNAYNGQMPEQTGNVILVLHVIFRLALSRSHRCRWGEIIECCEDAAFVTTEINR
jgi:hypothetical protein